MEGQPDSREDKGQRTRSCALHTEVTFWDGYAPCEGQGFGASKEEVI